MKTKVLYIYVLFLLVDNSYLLSDITNKIFSTTPNGLIAAFGDFNADKHVDLFMISDQGTALYVYLGDVEKDFIGRKLLDNITLGNDLKITSVVPADFDGDLQMDVLVTLKNKTKDNFVVCKIFFGMDSKLNTGNPLVLPHMIDQPLLMDTNADMIPDLLGEKLPGDRYFWIMSLYRNYTELKMDVPQKQENHSALRIPQSSAFVDLNNDLTADLCIVSSSDPIKLEYWINQNGVLTFNKSIPVTFEKQLKVVGQFLFADLDGDLKTDVLVPVCTNENCTESLLLVYHNTWISLPINFDYAGLTWNFIPPNQSGAPEFLLVPISLRIGDFNLDGYPDLLAVLGNATGNLHRAVILYNKACHSDCNGFSRTFFIDWDTWLEGHDDRALLPAFYDVFDNGILDIIVSSVDAKGSPTISVKKHDFVDDACFIKVTVVSGLCNYNCPGNRKPYGVNQPGPVVRFKTTDVQGEPQRKIAFQLSQSAYFSLQLPYTITGLGQTPNFIDVLEVGIPTNTSVSLHREWTSVIPNSQLLIIPYPIHSPNKWTNKLFVTPSRLMLLTGAALLGTCAFIAGLVGILHWRDKLEDKIEKRQEAQKFHFDAM